MNKYEMLYIIVNELTDEAKEATIAKFEKLVTDNGGNVEKIDKWGTKKLAYPINFKTEGYYVLMSFTSEPTFPRELSRKLRIADGIMRSLIVCKGEYLRRHLDAEQDHPDGSFDP